jgi:hypothetical protein
LIFCDLRVPRCLTPMSLKIGPGFVALLPRCGMTSCMAGWREHNAPEVPADEELPDEDELPRRIRIITLGREFGSNPDITAEERLRVLAVLGDTGDPEWHSVIAMFLRPALDLDMLRELWRH